VYTYGAGSPKTYGGMGTVVMSTPSLIQRALAEQGKCAGSQPPSRHVQRGYRWECDPDTGAWAQKPMTELPATPLLRPQSQATPRSELTKRGGAPAAEGREVPAARGGMGPIVIGAAIVVGAIILSRKGRRAA